MRKTEDRNNQENGTDVKIKLTKFDFQRIRLWGAEHGHTKLSKSVTALIRRGLDAEGMTREAAEQAKEVEQKGNGGLIDFLCGE